jgi:alpha-2-macroglobulin
VRLPARAGVPGSARIEAVAVSAEELDAVAGIVPIRPALSPRAVALYTELGDAGAFRLPIQVPRGSLQGFGGLELALSTSLLQSFADELLLPFREPELHVEATIARVLAVAFLGDGIEPVAAEGLPSPREMREQLQEDVEFLGQIYLRGWRASGGPRSGFSMPLGYLSTLASLDGALALHRASEAGYELPAGLREGLAVATDRHLSSLIRLYGERERARRGYLAYAIAYAAYVHQELAGGSGGRVAPWASGLAPDDLPSEALAWLYTVLSRDEGNAHLADGFRTALLNRLVEEAGTATFRTGPSLTVAGSAPHEERLLLDSRRRTDAIVLSALLRTEPHHPVLPRLVRGLVGHRAGAASEVRWGSIYEAGWLLMTLGDYVRIREEEVPDLTVRARLDGRVLAEEVFRGRSLRAARSGVALDELRGANAEEGGDASLLAVERSGTGTLYLRAGLRYSLSDPFQPPEDRGFLVTRRYEAVDDPGDVRRDADGAWRIRAGARVRVRVTLATTARRYQVRLRDALPAGFEAVNPGLEGALLPDPADDGPQASPAGVPPCFAHFVSPAHPLSYWANWTECRIHARLRMGLPWHTYRELRSDRVEAHTALLPAGMYETTYLVRATAPGTYVAAPPQAWEARHPETRGRGEADRVVVEGGG